MSLRTSLSPKKYYMDLRSFGPSTIFFCDGPVHLLPYDPQCHELFAIYLYHILLMKYYIDPLRLITKKCNSICSVNNQRCYNRKLEYLIFQPIYLPLMSTRIYFFEINYVNGGK